MPSNPYQPPHQESSDVNLRRRVSRRMVFWGGIATILLALVMFNGSHSLYVHSKAVDGHYERIVSLLDVCAVIAIVAGCVVLVERSHDLADRPVVSLVRPEVKWLGNILVVLAAITITIGTVVSGSGPNSGDADVTNRFEFDQRLVAWLHADVVLLFVGLVLGMVLILRLLNGPKKAVRRSWYLVAAVVASGTVGYFQLFTGLPWAAVTTHMLLAALLWVAVLRLRLALTARGPSPSGESEGLDLNKVPASAV